MGDPHAFYGINGSDLISLLNVAVSKDQAKEAVFVKMQGLIMQSPYFQSKINKRGIHAQDISFFTINDYKRLRDMSNLGITDTAVDGSIQIFSGTSNSASQVGRTLYAVVLDEVAAMIQDTDSKMSDFELYNKLKPSMVTFVPHGGRIVCISNPGTETGLLWKLYNDSLDEDNEDILMFQLSTQIVNPSIDKKFLEAEREKDPDQYMMMYEAEFLGGAIEPLLPEGIINAVFERGSSKGLARLEHGYSNVRYFAHGDPAKSNDFYSIVILHGEDEYTEFGMRKRIIIDHIQVWQPTREKPVSFDEVDDYIIDIYKKFNIVSLTLDQWESSHSSQILQRLGLPVSIVNFHGRHNQQIYTTLRELFTQDRIDIYNEPWDWANETKVQLKHLRKKYNRFGMKVEAATGYHDDITDCIAAAAYKCIADVGGGNNLPRMRLSKLQLDPSDRMYVSSYQGRRTGKNG